GQTRSLARGLAPVNIGSSDLALSLGELARRTTEFSRVRCVLECAEPVKLQDAAVARHLYRIAQEAVNNALKHAGAKKILIRLGEDENAVKLEISDDGRGFPRAKKSGPSMGLQVMKYRSGMIGGELQVESKSGKGVKITCILPKEGK
ncbi:MAG TPA: ATP-binding protein, partial [Verrucomicrobiae bacterium]|nr:ATP-binding protein [Verrucomicrobiae bacterium]